MEDWHDQDEWWEATGQVMFGERAWELAPQQVEQLFSLVALEPPLRVLDLPCGVGRHTVEFARLGCPVTAVDRTAAYLEQAKEHARESGLDVEFVKADMREFRRADAYDLAVNLFTSFGYFEDQSDDVQVLTNFYVSLRPGGVLVIDTMGKEVLAHIFTPRSWHELDDGTLVLEDRRVTRNWTWMENRWILVKNGERRDYPLSHRIYGASDLERLLVLVGFDPVQIYGDFSGTSYDHAAQRLVVVARKPAN